MSATGLEDAARGAFYGALIGDAASAGLLGLRRAPTPEELRAAMELEAGEERAAGQLSRYGEQMLGLGHAMTKQTRFDLDMIARGYDLWYGSTPPGLDTNDGEVFGAPNRMRDRGMEPSSFPTVFMEAARSRNANAETDNGLVRCLPLAIWSHRFSESAIAALAFQECGLTHPHRNCREAVAAYAIAVSELLLKPGNSKAAVARARSWLEERNSGLVHWLDQARRGKLPDERDQVQTGFVHAFHHLIKGRGYQESVRAALAAGVKASVVGGLVGAARGEAALPEAMRKAVFEAEVSDRPEALRAGQAPQIVAALLERAAVAIPPIAVNLTPTRPLPRGAPPGPKKLPAIVAGIALVSLIVAIPTLLLPALRSYKIGQQVKRLEEGELDEARAAAETFSNYGAAAVPDLVALRLSEKGDERSVLIALALNRLLDGGEEARSAVFSLLEHEDVRIRVLVCGWWSNCPEEIAALEAGLVCEDSATRLAAAGHLASTFETASTRFPKLLEVLVSGLDNRSPRLAKPPYDTVGGAAMARLVELTGLEDRAAIEALNRRAQEQSLSAAALTLEAMDRDAPVTRASEELRARWRAKLQARLGGD